MNDLCKHCEYGNRFMDLGQCPECDIGRIVGDLHTREIFCSNLHRITAVAVSFYGRQNCEEVTIFQQYEVIITSELSHEQLVKIGKYVEKTPVQIYQAVKKGLPFSERMNFNTLPKLCKFLYEDHIQFRIEPDVPVLHRFSECFPKLADDYQLIMESLYE